MMMKMQRQNHHQAIIQILKHSNTQNNTTQTVKYLQLRQNMNKNSNKKDSKNRKKVDFLNKKEENKREEH